MGFYVLCDYDEPDRETYRGIVIIDTTTNQESNRFYTGDFNNDYEAYQNWLKETDPYFYEGESVLNFLEEGQEHDASGDTEFYT